VSDAQQRGRVAAPVAALAASAGLPPGLVDVRHAAAHGAELPALPSLRLAAQRALRWLRAAYWQASLCGGPEGLGLGLTAVRGTLLGGM
jgi:hypothetical protein